MEQQKEQEEPQQSKQRPVIPKQYNDKIRHLKGKQVKLILDDEL
jgi:hypothetical protein